MAAVDELDSLLDSTLDEFTAETPSPAPVAAPPRETPRGPASDRLREAVVRLQTQFGDHPDFEILKTIISEEVTALEASAQAGAAGSPAKKKGKAKASSSGDSIFQKGFLNNASSKKKAPASSGGDGKDKKGAAAATDDLLQGLQKSTEDVASKADTGGLPGMPPGMPNMPGMPQSEEEMQKMLEQMLGGAGGGGGGDPDAFMNEMIAGLFSKDILYPSLTEVTEQYVVFLKESKDKFSEKQLAEFEGQHKLIKEMIGIYDDSSMATAAQSKKVMELMEKMSALGSPPEEIMKKLGLELGPNGMPMMPGSVPGQPGCSVM